MYKPTSSTVWKGRIDAADGDLGLRWHQVVKPLDLSKELPIGHGSYAFLGFCCDEGVRRNQGRIGAAQGPDAIRQALASMAVNLPRELSLYDAGDVLCADQHLERAQEQLGKKVTTLLTSGYRTIVLGGGHETAYGHYLGIQPVLGNALRLGIINFDAHFDLRNTSPQSSSGTPFRQIAIAYQEQDEKFSYLCLGIQEQSNTRQLFKTAEEVGADYVLADDLQFGVSEQVREKVNTFLGEVDELYISIDLDVFSVAHAPGVSAPAALGLQPQVVVSLLKEIMASGKVLTLDVVELNPSLDRDQQTAKLAASIIYQAVQNWC
ncbi:formimidoylglutamase [Rufibacter roseus]|uniref:Formimidoylglutamase n=1 Tax=Rufibacter roseus TaxID=1567108 RepID=A0ABW2DPD3_9BACT|nr:formimidoylglutamase [Rufibacter roseus]